MHGDLFHFFDAEWYSIVGMCPIGGQRKSLSQDTFVINNAALEAWTDALLLPSLDPTPRSQVAQKVCAFVIVSLFPGDSPNGLRSFLT